MTKISSLLSAAAIKYGKRIYVRVPQHLHIYMPRWCTRIRSKQFANNKINRLCGSAPKHLICQTEGRRAMNECASFSSKFSLTLTVMPSYQQKKALRCVFKYVFCVYVPNGMGVRIKDIHSYLYDGMRLFLYYMYLHDTKKQTFLLLLLNEIKGIAWCVRVKAYGIVISNPPSGGYAKLHLRHSFRIWKKKKLVRCLNYAI